MTSSESSYSQILRSTSIMGGATIAVILVGLVRMKLFALLVGSAGVGLFGLLNSLIATGGAIAGLGVGSSGVRQLAAAADAGRAQIRRAMWLSSLAAGALGALMLWWLWQPLEHWLVGDRLSASASWLALAVFLTVVSACQAGILQGYRRVGDLARVRLYGALLSALVGVTAVYLFRKDGILPALAIIPGGMVLFGAIYLARIPRTQSPRGGIAAETRLLVSLGLVLMSATLISGGLQLAARALIADRLGLEAAGLYHAAWAASTGNVGLVLAAMAADYFPRLSAVADDREAAAGLVNQQLRVALLLGGPGLLALAAAAPIVLQILYSSEFVAATSLLRWHVAGDALKLLGWTLGFLLPANGAKSLFLTAEALFAIAFLTACYLLLPLLDVEGIGVAHLLANLIYAAFLIWLCRRRFDVRLARGNALLLSILMGAIAAIIGVAGASPNGALILGLIAAAVLGGYSVHSLRKLGGGAFHGLASTSRSGPESFQDG